MSGLAPSSRRAKEPDTGQIDPENPAPPFLGLTGRHCVGPTYAFTPDHVASQHKETGRLYSLLKSPHELLSAIPVDRPVIRSEAVCHNRRRNFSSAIFLATGVILMRPYDSAWLVSAPAAPGA